MLININPLDTLFFRDGRPFSMGEETWADGIFPPSPSVFYGALRTAYFAEHMDKLPEANKENDPTKNLEINRICYKKEVNYYFHVPQDLVIDKRDSFLVNDKREPFKVFPLKLKKFQDLVSSSPTNSILISPGAIFQEVESVTDGLLDQASLEKYLSNKDNDLKVISMNKHIKSEPKIGIGRKNYTHSSEEGLLYRVGMKRITDISIILEFNSIEIPEKGILKFGGEGKLIRYDRENDVISIKPPEIKSNMFKIYLATPAFLSNGWIPSWIEEDTLEGTIPGTGGRVKLITCVIGKTFRLGGFDMKEKKAKPMRTIIPAGSVYYFECIEGAIEDIIKKIHGKSISDFEQKQGFGICFLGGVRL